MKSHLVVLVNDPDTTQVWVERWKTKGPLVSFTVSSFRQKRLVYPPTFRYASDGDVVYLLLSTLQIS